MANFVPMHVKPKFTYILTVVPTACTGWMGSSHIWHNWSLIWEGRSCVLTFDNDLTVFLNCQNVTHFSLCPLCSVQSSEWIIFIFGTNNHYFQQGCTKWRTWQTSPPQADFDRAGKIRPILLTLWLSLISLKIQTWKIKMTHFWLISQGFW